MIAKVVVTALLAALFGFAGVSSWSEFGNRWRSATISA